jgi:hypothetical protein
MAQLVHVVDSIRVDYRESVYWIRHHVRSVEEVRSPRKVGIARVVDESVFEKFATRYRRLYML